MGPATIRWLKRPRPVQINYVCDQCSTTHSNFIAPDMITEGPLHRCRYTTATGTKRDVWRLLHRDT